MLSMELPTQISPLNSFELATKSKEGSPMALEIYFTGVSFVLLAVLMISTNSKYKYKRSASTSSTTATDQPSNAAPSPPMAPGLPFLGSGLEFGRDAVRFLQSRQRQLGDFFTVRLPFNRIHFLMNPHGIDTLVQHAALQFNPIQQMVNRNVFGFALHEDRRIIREVARSARNADNLAAALGNFAQFLNSGLVVLGSSVAAAVTAGNESETRRMPMKEFLIDTQFRAIFNAIFGNSDAHSFNHRSARADFDVFHRYFNYLWLGFPLRLFGKASAALHSLIGNHPAAEELLAREDLSPYLRTAMLTMRGNGQTHSDIVGHNLVFLHVNYNTYKITYWILKYLICQPEARAALREEIARIFDVESKDGVVPMSMKELESMPILDSIVNESFRLSSGVLVIREVVEDTELDLSDMQARRTVAGGDEQAATAGKFSLKKGEKVAFYPPALHKNGEIFEDFQTFQFDRFVDKEFSYGGSSLTRLPVMPYGSLCPGQRLSRLQIKMTVIALMLNFDMAFDAAHSDGPQYNLSCYGHEILPPLEDVDVLLKPASAAAGGIRTMKLID